MDNNIDLTPYCTTIKQKEIYDIYKKYLNYNDTAKEANMTANAVECIIRRLKYRSEFTKLQDSIKNDPNVKSTSTLYNGNGEVVSQWVKKDTSKNHIKKLVKDYIEEYSKKLPKFKPVKCKKQKYEKLLAIYPIVDVHVGMLSWMAETGNNYSTKMADKIVRETVTKLIDRTPACEECIIANLGDFLHVDNQVYQTERSGNVLDVDGRYAKILNIAIKLMRYMIEYALLRHKKVTVINCQGNHDDLGSLWLSAALSNIYEKESRLNIVNSPAPRHYYSYGDTLIGFTHGNDVKANNLCVVMATEKSKEWGSSKFRYFYTGHWHQDKVVEVGDCKIESFRAVCAKDAFSVSKGYMSGRDMKCIIIGRNCGECERYTINI